MLKKWKTPPATRSPSLQSFNLPLAPYLPAGKKPRETMGLGTEQLLMVEGDMGLEQKKLWTLLVIFFLKRRLFILKEGP